MKKNARMIIVLAIFIVFVIGIFYFFSKKDVKEEEPTEVEVSQMEELLSRNLEINYPPTPREVLRYYNDITKALHDESYTDEQIQEVANKLRLLYDDELVENQTQEEYFEKLKQEVDNFKDSGITISSYEVSSSTDVETFSQDGYEWARLYTFYNMRIESSGKVTYQKENQVFLLRKDLEDQHWKIYGFQLAEQ